MKQHCIVLFSDITHSNGKGVVFMTTCDNVKQHCNLFQTLPKVMMLILRSCLYTVLYSFSDITRSNDVYFKIVFVHCSVVFLCILFPFRTIVTVLFNFKPVVMGG